MKKAKNTDAVANAKKCKEKAEDILLKFGGPEVKNFYRNLIAKADAIIATSENIAAVAMTPLPASPPPGIQDLTDNDLLEIAK